MDAEPPSDGDDEMDAEEDKPPDTNTVYRLRWEPVNVEVIEQALQLDAVRRVRLANYDLFAVLLSIRSRIVNVKGKVGWIPVLERECAEVGGKKQRLWSGITGVQPEELPRCIQRELREGVPPELAGVSAFHFCRAIKYLVRSGLDMGEYDLANSLFEVLAGLTDLPPAVERYRTNRDDVLQGLSSFMSDVCKKQVRPKDIKKLMISIAFGGTTHGWMIKHIGKYHVLEGHWADFLTSFEAAMKTVRKTLAEKAPVALKNAVKDRANPQASNEFVLYAEVERTLLETMRVAASRSFLSPEHDGFGGKAGAHKQTQAAVSAIAPNMIVAYTPYPEDPYELLKLQAPELDWTRQAPCTAAEWQEIVVKCQTYLANGPKAVKDNAMTFARFVAMKLRATTNVPTADGERRTHFEVFDHVRGFWFTRHVQDLPTVITQELISLVRPVARSRWERGHLPDAPPPLNDGRFAASIDQLVLGILSEDPPMRELDGDHSRGKLLFSCGTVMDFDDNGSCRKAIPEDRLGHQMACKAEVYAPPVLAAGAGSSRDDVIKPETILEDIATWIKTGTTQLRDTEVGLRIVEKLKALSNDCKVLGVLVSFAGNWEGVIWLLRTTARMATGNPRICEFLYLFGPGSSGKDVVMLLLLSFFGSGSFNYGCMLNGSFIVDGKAGGKEAASPFLAATAGKRFIWASEVPQHQNLQVELIKQYCEQSGALITARKLYKAPVSFRPIGVICATGNFPPCVTHKDDTGYIRRARVWQTSQTFSVKPKTLTEVLADPTVKQKIMKGTFNSQLLCLVLGLAPTLSPELNPETELEPRPVFMKEMEEECAEDNSHAKLKAFIVTHTLPCERKDATPMKEFKKQVAQELGMGKMQAGVVMAACGYDIHGKNNVNSDRVAVGFHPARGDSKGDGLKLKE